MSTDKVDVESVQVVDPPLLRGHVNGETKVERRALPPAPSARKRSHWWVWLLVVAALAVVGWLAYPSIMTMFKPVAKGKRVMRGAPVVVATARKGDMPIYLDEIGTVTALNTVTVHTRVDGQLDKVAFVEGQMVKQGQLLAELDARPFQVQLTQAQGQLARDQALLDNAKVDLKRYQDAKAAVSQQQLDTAAATVEQDAGNIKSDQGAIDSAKLNITYCRVTSPLTGKIGLREVDAGNIVHAADTNGLAVITQLQPITVLFSVAQDDVPAILEKMHAGQKLQVLAYDRTLTTKLATGVLAAADSAIDQTTSKLRFKATFTNEDGALFPNQFVNVRLLIDTKRNVVIVPTAAIQMSPESMFVYVVKKEAAGSATEPAKRGDAGEEAASAGEKSAASGKAGATTKPAAPERIVEMRKVTIGDQQGEETIVASGVNAGEVVVVDGVDKLQDGAKVTIGRADATTRSAGQPATQPGAATEPAGSASQPGEVATHTRKRRAS